MMARILVVDVDLTAQRVLGTGLGRVGHHVETATDGDRVWSILVADPSGFALIVAGIMIPGMDGFELLRRIRGNPATSDLPVILMATMSNEVTAAEEQRRERFRYLDRFGPRTVLVYKDVARGTGAMVPTLLELIETLTHR